MKIAKILGLAMAAIFVVTFIVGGTAFAVPDFATKLQTDQALGHSAWPMLNKFGRDAKESGYNLTGGSSIRPNILIKGYLYDQKKDKDEKLRPFHEYELFVAGRASDKMSVFLEVEGEDENGFEPEVEMGVITYHLAQPMNIQAGYGPILFADPYDTLSDIRRMTRNKKVAVLSSEILGTRQFVSIYGRYGNLFYITALGGEHEDTEGEDPQTSAWRVAYDVIPQMTVGAMSISNEDKEVKGLDTQVELGGLIGHAAYVTEEAGNKTKSGYYLEGSYIAGGIVPTVRYENYEKPKGWQSELTTNLSVYVAKNAKVGLEYWNTLETAPGSKDNNRVTAMFTVVF